MYFNINGLKGRMYLNDDQKFFTFLLTCRLYVCHGYIGHQSKIECIKYKIENTRKYNKDYVAQTPNRSANVENNV